ncbi:kinase-like domain-containing protein [Paraphoma chrysanthemicola]|uniref:Kinase-like domain-containing protein n=1 Tax=Paraphoma chrysanthemicola TaxID=798071 RepID=A0A8K0QUM6_9PLEO|nr:kinase-like domain-containing protein [Paraphoma chrysanthemicola]
MKTKVEESSSENDLSGGVSLPHELPSRLVYDYLPGEALWDHFTTPTEVPRSDVGYELVSQLYGATKDLRTIHYAFDEGLQDLTSTEDAAGTSTPHTSHRGATNREAKNFYEAELLRESHPYSIESLQHATQPWCGFLFRQLADFNTEIYPRSVTRTAQDSVYFTAAQTITIFHSAAGPISSRGNTLDRQSEYTNLLRSSGVKPTDHSLEQNWSGRGQHVEFKANELALLHEIIETQDTLGRGQSAVVHSVRCRRILLARKTVYTDKHFTKRQAAQEVAHLDRLKHSHVVRLIGTYTWKKELSILMYPVADYNLAGFLDVLKTHSVESNIWTAMLSSCRGFFACLSNAIEHIHERLTKHMDIKPQNILVRTDWQYRGAARNAHVSKVYISDFGISKSYHSLDAVETDSDTAFTRKYAAPEVVRQDKRGLAADIFSLGCVFLEIFATLESIGTEPLLRSRVHREVHVGDATGSTMLHRLEAELSSHHDTSYGHHIEALHEIFGFQPAGASATQVPDDSPLRTILSMIDRVPTRRPTAQQLIQQYPARACCKAGPDILEALKQDGDNRFEEDISLPEDLDTRTVDSQAQLERERQSYVMQEGPNFMHEPLQYERPLFDSYEEYDRSLTEILGACGSQFGFEYDPRYNFLVDKLGQAEFDPDSHAIYQDEYGYREQWI